MSYLDYDQFYNICNYNFTYIIGYGYYGMFSTYSEVTLVNHSFINYNFCYFWIFLLLIDSLSFLRIDNLIYIYIQIFFFVFFNLFIQQNFFFNNNTFCRVEF